MTAPHLTYSLDPPRHPVAALSVAGAGAVLVLVGLPAGWLVVAGGVWSLRRRGAWYLADPWTANVNGYQITIPEGFRFDLASIPRPLWLVVAPYELGVSAPLVHDYLYAYRGRPPAGDLDPSPSQPFSRRKVDRWFRLLMAVEQVPRARRTVAWAAVRLFGWVPWLLPR